MSLMNRILAVFAIFLNKKKSFESHRYPSVLNLFLYFDKGYYIGMPCICIGNF